MPTAKGPAKPRKLTSAVPAEPELLDAAPRNCLMIGGAGDPATSPGYQAAVEALFTLAYGLHFALKKRGVLSPGVSPLEGLWFAPGVGTLTFEELQAQRGSWQWTMLIEVPDAVTAELLGEVRAAALRKHPERPLDAVRLETFAEGQAAQLLHVGPYTEEKPTLERLHEFIAAHGLKPRGRHHEIYLNDPRRVAPAKIRTILRQPVEPGPTG